MSRHLYSLLWKSKPSLDSRVLYTLQLHLPVILKLPGLVACNLWPEKIVCNNNTKINYKAYFTDQIVSCCHEFIEFSSHFRASRNKLSILFVHKGLVIMSWLLQPWWLIQYFCPLSLTLHSGLWVDKRALWRKKPRKPILWPLWL